MSCSSCSVMEVLGVQTLFQKDHSAPLSWILITHFYNYDQSCTRLQLGDEKFGNYR